MAKKKQEEESGGSWMDTYGDMVTLLLTFFVMLYSMSSIVEEKWVALVSAFKVAGDEKIEQLVFVENDAEGQEGGSGAHVGTFESDDPYEGTYFNSAMDSLYDKIMSYLEDSDLVNSILMQMTSEETASKEENSDGDTGEKPGDTGQQKEPAKNISIQFKDNVLFNPDESTIRPESEEILQFLGDCLASVKDDVSYIIIKGHTAISPTSTVDTRLLSTERAGTISNFFEYRSGIPSMMLKPIGLGSDYPIASNDDEEGRRQNRRVEIVIINKNSTLGKNTEFLKAMGASFDSSSDGTVSGIDK